MACAHHAALHPATQEEPALQSCVNHADIHSGLGFTRTEGGAGASQRSREGALISLDSFASQGWDGRRAAHAPSWQACAPPSSQTHKATVFQPQVCLSPPLMATPHRQVLHISPGPVHVAAQQLSTSMSGHRCSADQFQGSQLPLTTRFSYYAHLRAPSVPGKFTFCPRRGILTSCPGQSMHVN